MATLTSTKIKNTYDALLKATDNDAIGSSAKQITDGLGNGTPLYISTTQIGIGVTPESTYDLHVYSNAKVGGNLTVTGDLTVDGTVTTVSSQTLTVTDPLIELAKDNTSTDALDIGFYGKYAPSGTTLYAGLFRDTGDSKFKLFRNLQEQPTTTVNTAGTGYTKADLVLGDLDAQNVDVTSILTTSQFTASSHIILTAAGSDSVINGIKQQNSNRYFNFQLGASGGLKSFIYDGVNPSINWLSVDTSGNATFSDNIIVSGTGSFTGQVTIPETPSANTDAASKGYVDSQITAQDLDFAGGTGTGAVDLDSQTFTITGTTNEIETSASGQTLTIGLPNDVTIGNDLTVTTDLDVGGLITVGTNDTVLQNDKLIFKSTTGAAIGHNTAGTAIQFYTTTTTALDTLALTISGNDLTVSGELSVSGTGQSSFAGQVTIPATPVASTDAASKGYVDSQVGDNNELSEVLANGNTTGGTDIAVSTGDDITFADGSNAYFGNSNDLRIAHVGGNSKIQESGTGSLVLDTNGTSILLTKSDTEHLAKFLTDGAVELYYDNSKKLETTSTGVSVTGDGDALSVNRGSFNVVTNLTSVNHNIISTGKAFNIKTSDSNGLFFSTNNTLAVTIDTSQRVGIGTTSPSAKLMIETGADEGIRIYRTATNANFGAIEFRNSNDTATNSRIGFGTNYMRIEGTDNLQFITNSAERMRIDSSGNVGISNTNPSSYYSNANNLVVGSHTGSNGISILSATNQTGWLVFADSTAGGDNTRGAIAYDHSANSMSMRVNNDTKMRIDSSGQSIFYGDVTLDSDSTKLKIGDSQDLQLYHDGSHSFIDNSTGTLYLRNTSTGSIIIRNSTGGDIQFDNEYAGNILFNTSNIERMRITSGGSVGIGETNPTYRLNVKSSNNLMHVQDTSGTSSATFVLFSAPSYTPIGSITRNGSAGSILYNTSSDYRLKEDLQDFNALNLIDNITAYDYKWKDTDQRDYGFVAHELQEVMPNVVTGEKDGEMMQGVDYAKLTPVLLKAIQELKAEIETLKAQINN